MDSNLNDDDIICLLDGDDKLIVDSALDTIDRYNDNTLLTYGQYIWPNGHIGHCKKYTEYEFSMKRRLLGITSKNI
jgi:hypothetical protein